MTLKTGGTTHFNLKLNLDSLYSARFTEALQNSVKEQNRSIDSFSTFNAVNELDDS